MMVHTVRNMEQNMGIICKHTEYLRTEMQAVKRGYQGRFQTINLVSLNDDLRRLSLVSYDAFMGEMEKK